MYEGIMLRGGLGKLDPVLVAREQGRAAHDGFRECSSRLFEKVVVAKVHSPNDSE